MPGTVRSVTEQLFDELAPQQQAKTPTKQLGKEDFLKLLTLQLRSQNPLDPTSNQEMAAQLAQFSALEQMQNINATLEQLLQSNTSLALQMAQYTAPSLIGKTAQVSSSQVTFDGNSTVAVGYQLASAATEGTIEIRSSSGALLRSIRIPASELNAGTHHVEWDGRDDRGQRVPAGTYSITIRAQASDGTTVTATPLVRGTITGIRYSSSGLMVLLGALEVPISSIIELS
jgi:flagellar basal-body rod modification protein FlgD